ncbi:hypothetical protein SAMN06297280_0867 [Arsukibacterium tuosuense]|uniref:Uncharacterized protein n=1 Tax=Arsukibacterium tuosuense TaxID=1323745 RepID=A0A285IBZ8_9GAMM|nr:hypothetical protein [Arsukibacterium tuosuense]SNY45307.1 hypothetical protein SAMN06297280_0867 [Arsukibacterium tuosuense]
MQTTPRPNNHSKLKRLLAYSIAVLLAAALGSIVQSQFNLVAIAGLVEQLPAGDWLYTVWFDLRSFTPTMLVIMAPVLLLALLASRLLHTTVGVSRLWLAVGCSLVGLLLALWAINNLAPMPTLIAASRGVFGSLALALCAGAGAAIYVRLTSRGNM